MIYLVWYLAKGNSVTWCLQSNCRRVALEVTYLVFSPVLTLMYASVPFITHEYGLAGPWCWIKALDKDCTVTLSGLLNQLFYGYIIFILNGTIGIVLTIAVVFCRLLQESWPLLKKAFFSVMVCFFVYIIIQVYALTIRIATAEADRYQGYAVWFIFGITYPISLLLIPVAFISPPSNSLFWNTLHTDAFTHITTESAPLVHKEATDTGYGRK